MLPRLPTLAFAVAVHLATPAFAAPLDDAIALYKEKKYPDARAALEQIIAAEPTNAAAAYYLGMTLLRRGDAKAFPDGVPWLEKAATLEPTNARYLADYGGASMQLAGQVTSLSAATKGRDAMEKSLKIDPTNLDAREGLYQFYTKAPWPLGSSSKAQIQLDGIRKLNPDRATTLSVMLKVEDKDFAAAFKLLDGILAKNPDDYTALYHYGRTAAISGLNLATGLTCLQKTLTLTLPGPASPKPTDAWNRIGNIEEKLSHPAEARTAYETALKLDPNNKQAASSLAKLK